MSDFAVITSDNPRLEEPGAIIEEILAGVTGDRFVAIEDRGAAVREAVSRAAAGDVVVVAGKGHETYQEIKGVRHHLDDRELIQAALKAAGRN
jgi:UDP-N-acetylmuramoyl-L-alanyl-D-glutamate--2,6-diaminopimelate ligase